MSRAEVEYDRPRAGGRAVRTAAIGVAVVGMGVLAFVLWSAGTQAEAEPQGQDRARAFSSYIEDLPVMPGLAESEDGYVFDLEEGGRLAEARLSGDADPAVVRGFYAATLSQLGWTASEADPYVYHRGSERLIFLLEPRRRGGRPLRRGLQAVFVISPEQPPGVASAPVRSGLG